MKNINIFLCLLLCIFLAACAKKTDESSSNSSAETTSTDAAAEAANNQVSADEKLGTKWGDEIDSKVTEVQLKRKSETSLAETIV